MKVKIYFLISLSFIILFASVVILYGKKTVKSIDYKSYYETALYTYLERETYSTWIELQNFLIDDNEIDSIQDVADMSDAVLVIEAMEDPLLYGNGIINQVIVKDVIKGESIKVNEKIEIYDLLFDWSSFQANYLGGSTPLKAKEEYIVFLKKNLYPSKKDTYVFSSIMYGHIKKNTPGNYLANYQKFSFKVNEVAEYDYIFGGTYTEEDVRKYMRIVGEATEFIKNSIDL